MKKLFPILMLAGLPLFGCSGNADEPAATEVFSESDITIATQLSDFNIEFFKAANAEAQPDENVVVSPLSASLLLSMLANVADGATAADIAEVIGCDDVSGLNVLSAKYLKYLPQLDKSTKLNFANSVWYQKDYTLNPIFSSVLGKYYNADTFERQLQTNDSKVIAEINDWVSNKTKNNITKIVNQLNPNTVAILINTLYFKSDWANRFKEENTKRGSFAGSNGVVMIDMMHKTEKEYYGATEAYEVVKLGFGNGAYEAVMLLPGSDVTLSEILATDALNELDKIGYSKEIVELTFPKFKVEPEALHLNRILEALGIESIGGWSESSIFTEPQEIICDVIQKTTVEFTESGAEAAAATWSGLDTANPSTVYELEFNRPFMFFIRETTTGAMLFAGKIVNL